MADLDQTLETSQDNRSQERIKQLSDKVELTAKERDELKGLKEQAEAKAADLQKERDFFQGFADVVATNPAARDHRDEILEKVKAGYSVEDATNTVLIKAGKFQQEAVVERPIVAGGSAQTQIPSSADKRPAEMTQDERRQALIEADRRGELDWLKQ